MATIITLICLFMVLGGYVYVIQYIDQILRIICGLSAVVVAVCGIRLIFLPDSIPQRDIYTGLIEASFFSTFAAASLYIVTRCFPELF